MRSSPHPPGSMALRRRRTGIALGMACAIGACSHSAAAPTSLPEPRTWTAAQDHAQMMEQLGIRALRPGPSGNEQDSNHANYDESKANPFPDLPDVLRLKSGAEVTDARMWRQRRAEIVEDFEREVVGRIPKNVPKVIWTVAATDT